MAGAHIENAEREIWRAIKKEDKEYLKVVFETILDATEAETKAQSVKEAKTYIMTHWENIKHQYSNDYSGCSAEGHIAISIQTGSAQGRLDGAVREWTRWRG